MENNLPEVKETGTVQEVEKYQPDIVQLAFPHTLSTHNLNSYSMSRHTDAASGDDGKLRGVGCTGLNPPAHWSPSVWSLLVLPVPERGSLLVGPPVIQRRARLGNWCF